MGFESFRVELRGGPASYRRAEEALRRRPGARPDHASIETRGSAYYTVEDGSHVIEVEVSDSPVRVSCRFTLCHPPSVDSALLGLVRELMARLGMEAWICDDVLPGHSQGFSRERFSDFANVFRRQVSARRAEWVANFGPEHLPARTSEVYEQLILPRCDPIAG